MIYVGLIKFNDAIDNIHTLSAVLESYIHTAPTVINKNFLTLCYGKLSTLHDMDDIWENKTAVVMGQIFDKTQNIAVKKQDFHDLANLNKEKALANIWGKYIYISVDAKALQADIVIDATGQLPLFYYIYSSGNVLFSSNIEIIFKIIAEKPEYNWNYLCSYIIYENISGIQTAFKNIYELPPACCLKITKNARKTEPFWDPLSLQQTKFATASTAVNIMQQSLKPWIEPYKNICVSLSGGLDSSALVYCLKDIKREDQKLSAINFFHSYVKLSNELIYARQVCKETDIDLVEIDFSNSLPFTPSLKKHALIPNKPAMQLVNLKWLETVYDNIPLNDACIFLSGIGSDQIFMRPPSKKSISDYILEHGFKGCQHHLQNITQFYREPFYPIVKENIISLSAHFFYKCFGKKSYKNIPYKTPYWIKRGMHQNTSSDFTHPIFKNLPAQVLPAKHDQIVAFYQALNSMSMGINQFNPPHYPFLYQPVVEFALSFPTYELFENGYDRYPLRKAVSDQFKTETVWRRDKSQTTGLSQLGVKKNLANVLAICMEGQFAKQNLIDTDGLYKTILLISNGDTQHMLDFTRLAACEIFFKYWEQSFGSVLTS